MGKFIIVVLILLSSCNREPTNKPPLLEHIVLINLKEDSLVQEFYAEAKKLKKISCVKKFEFGIYEDLDDPKALADYDIIMKLSFDHEKDFREYQEHPIHKSSKEATKHLLGAPPVSYHYYEQ